MSLLFRPACLLPSSSASPISSISARHPTTSSFPSTNPSPPGIKFYYSNMPQFTTDADPAALTADLDELTSSPKEGGGGGGWTLDGAQVGIRKTYAFGTYTKVLDFHHLIGIASKAKNHHPEMTTKPRTLTVYWTTHQPSPGGLSAKDIAMARWCDEQARMVGTA